jgi:hypothetical protein
VIQSILSGYITILSIDDINYTSQFINFANYLLPININFYIFIDGRNTFPQDYQLKFEQICDKSVRAISPMQHFYIFDVSNDNVMKKTTALGLTY